MVFVAFGRRDGPRGEGDLLDARSRLIDRNHRNQIPLLQLGKRRRNIDPGGALGKRILDDKCAPMQVGQQCRGCLEIQAQIFVALEIKEDYVPASDARVRMPADCILKRHLKPPPRTIGIEGESATASHEAAVSSRSLVTSFQCGSLLTAELLNSSQPPGVPFVSLEAVPSSMIMVISPEVACVWLNFCCD
jgi:hypothetical protein